MSTFTSETRLAQREAARANRAAAAERDQLIDSIRPLANKRARGFRNQGVSAEDLGQVALLAAVAASKTFDPELGAFSSHVYGPITQALTRAVAKSGAAVVIPEAVQQSAYHLRNIGTEGTLKTNAAHLAAAAAWRTATPLDAPAATDGTASIGELIPSRGSTAEIVEDRLYVEHLLAGLTETQRFVMRNLANIDPDADCLSRQELAAALGATPQAVDGIRKRASAQLKLALAAA
jgi:RNA polymerase sigma factor (sigma-70 family)